MWMHNCITENCDKFPRGILFQIKDYAAMNHVLELEKEGPACNIVQILQTIKAIVSSFYSQKRK